MTNTEVKQLANLESLAVKILNIGARKFNISARAYMRTIKVARTIADLEASAKITGPHITEALSYRINAYDNQQPKKDRQR